MHIVTCVSVETNTTYNYLQFWPPFFVGLEKLDSTMHSRHWDILLGVKDPPLKQLLSPLSAGIFLIFPI